MPSTGNKTLDDWLKTPSGQSIYWLFRTK
jgi:hypothetical protein